MCVLSSADAEEVQPVVQRQEPVSFHPPQYNPEKQFVTSVDGTKIYYELYGRNDVLHKPIARVVMITGLACGVHAWRWQLKDLLHSEEGGHSPCHVALVENRGIGHSGCPEAPHQYSTTIMAQDVLTVLDDLGWPSAHVVGFSLGGMIASKLAALAPSRCDSLTLLATTGGGWQVVPLSLRGLGLAVASGLGLMSGPDTALAFHFMRDTLQQWLPHHGQRRGDVLREEYRQHSAGRQDQPAHGLKGQMRAAWTHCLSAQDAAAIRQGCFPVLVVHGRGDLLAAPCWGDRLARRLGGSLALLQGAHFIQRECAVQVNGLLRGQVLVGPGCRLPPSAYLEPDVSPTSTCEFQEDGL